MLPLYGRLGSFHSHHLRHGNDLTMRFHEYEENAPASTAS